MKGTEEMQIVLKKMKLVALFSAEQFALSAFGIWGPVFQGIFLIVEKAQLVM